MQERFTVHYNINQCDRQRIRLKLDKDRDNLDKDRKSRYRILFRNIVRRDVANNNSTRLHGRCTNS